MPVQFTRGVVPMTTLMILSCSAPAEAREAPIVYARSAPSPAAAGPASYGYGRLPAEGAPIDIRPSPIAAASNGLQDRPNWLERERTGPPYQANGVWFVPTAEPGYAETGVASFYGDEFKGRRTASGEAFDPNALTAAHPTLPLPSLVQVTNLDNGREVILRVTDRGPFTSDRIIDVSAKAAELLGFSRGGTARVHVRYLGPAPKKVAAADAASAAPTAPPPVADPPETAAPEFPPVGEPPLARPTPRTAQATGGFFVQVAAFADRSNADRARLTLSSAGAAFVEEGTSRGRSIYRVRLGPVAGPEEAEAARLAAAGLGFPGATITAAR